MSQFLPVDLNTLGKDGSILQQRGAILLVFLTHHARACGVEMCEFNLFEDAGGCPALAVSCHQCKIEITTFLNHDDPIFSKGPTTLANTLPF